MMRRLVSNGGFLVMEVLMVIAILATVFTTFMGVASLSLQTTARSVRTTEAISWAETLLFEIEGGARADLTMDGEQVELAKGYICRVKTRVLDDFVSAVAGCVLEKSGREVIDFRMIVLQAPIQ